MTLAGGISYVGGDPQKLDNLARGPSAVAGYLEVHIEQARSLESADIPVGVVTGIAAIQRERILIRGQTDHAGATPMVLRRDALVAASELIVAVERRAAVVTTDDAPLVATIGWIAVRPNAANAVAGEVELILESRSTDPKKLDHFLADDVTEILSELNKSGFTVGRENISKADATPCGEQIVEAIEAAAREGDFASMRMQSGAGHDGVFVAKTGPIGMIFLPCRDGRSHTPEEWADQKDCSIAAQVMLDTLLKLDQA
jgi:N-carbamoyl-L-amino-acid hydrolase